jgi:hypothetical protein
MAGTMTSTSFYARITQGQFDICAGVGWGGDEFSPFETFQECYLDENNRWEPYPDKAVQQSLMITLTLPGETAPRTYSLWQWGTSLAGDAEQNGVTINFSLADTETKAMICSVFEYYWLSFYVNVPESYTGNLGMLTKQCRWAADEYITLLGFGGITYMTYTMSDAQWAAYLAQNLVNGALDYSVA